MDLVLSPPPIKEIVRVGPPNLVTALSLANLSSPHPNEGDDTKMSKGIPLSGFSLSWAFILHFVLLN